MTEVEVFDREDAGGWEMEVRDDWCFNTHLKIYMYTLYFSANICIQFKEFFTFLVLLS